MLQKILIPLDGSELAEKALPYAESLTQQYEGELILLMVIQPVYFPAVGSHYGEPIVIDLPTVKEKREEADTYLRKLHDELTQRGVRSRIEILEKEAVADGIIDVATNENVDVIVKTTHGRSGLSRWIYGNVATKVLQGAPCPIFLVRVSGN